MKSIKFSELLKIVKPQYTYLKLIPDLSIRNYNSSNIAKAIHLMQKNISKRIRKEEKGLIFETLFKCSYIIDIFKDKVDFYFIVPQQYTSIAKEKIRETWARCTIEEVTEIQPFNKSALIHELVYKREDTLSLEVDKKNNEPLNNILNTINIMETDDRVSIIYNFIPTNQFSWRAEYDSTVDKIKHRLPIEKQKLSIKYISKLALSSIIGLVDSIMEVLIDFLGSPRKENNNQLSLLDLAITTLNVDKDLTPATKKKRDSIILNTQLLVVTESEDKTRRNNNAVSVCQSFKSIDGDNELIYRKIKSNKPIEINTYSYPTQINKCSIDECANFIQLPGRELLQEYKFINQVKTLETKVPEELQKGNFNLGISKYRENETKAYIRSKYKFESLPLLLIAPQGAGKTTIISNFANDAYKAKQCNIIIDFIKNCELSEAVKKVIPKEDIIEIDLSKEDGLQAFAFNEVNCNSTNEDELIEIANMKAEQTLAFIDSINTEGKPLTSKMRRYISAASNIVYLQQNTSIGDVIDCLEKFKKRQNYVTFAKGVITSKNKFLYEDDFSALEELDDITEIKDNKKLVIGKEVTGTKDSKIEGILDRVNLLKENIKLKKMFYMSSKNNVNFIKAMNEHKTILIKMPESKFPSTMVKNVITTFYTSKIVLCAKIRGSQYEEPPRVNVYYDEIYQAPTSEYVLNNVAAQLRKFGLKIIISGHFFKQLLPEFRDSLLNVGTSFMLLHGCTEENYNELKTYLQPFTIDDLVNLEQFKSLNLINYEGGYAKFITKLPPPMK